MRQQITIKTKINKKEFHKNSKHNTQIQKLLPDIEYSLNRCFEDLFAQLLDREENRGKKSGEK